MKKGDRTVTSVVRKNRLIIQGRLLRDKPQDAEMTFEGWFAEYHALTEDLELKGEQGRIIDSLATELTAVQLASQMKSLTQ